MAKVLEWRSVKSLRACVWMPFQRPLVTTSAVRFQDLAAVGGVAGDFLPAQRLVVLELGIEGVDPASPIGLRLELDDSEQAVAGELVRFHVRLDALDEQLLAGAGIEVVIAPDVDILLLDRLQHARIAERPAHRAGVVLVDIGGVEAVALVLGVGVELALVVDLAAKPDDDGALGLVERPHGQQVDGAADRLRGQRRVGGLVDHRAAQQLGRELVELDRAVVVRRNHLAPVQRGGGEVRGEAADRQFARASVEALRGEAGQARQQFRDRGVGQLADVLGGDDFDDRSVVALLVDRASDRAADAGDDDGAVALLRVLGRFGGGGRRRRVLGRLIGRRDVGRRCLRERRRCRHRQRDPNRQHARRAHEAQPRINRCHQTPPCVPAALTRSSVSPVAQSPALDRNLTVKLGGGPAARRLYIRIHRA